MTPLALALATIGAVRAAAMLLHIIEWLDKPKGGKLRS